MPERTPPLETRPDTDTSPRFYRVRASFVPPEGWPDRALTGADVTPVRAAVQSRTGQIRGSGHRGSESGGFGYRVDDAKQFAGIDRLGDIAVHVGVQTPLP